jgi:drug/metabolite transporter (DMT)-like permease
LRVIGTLKAIVIFSSSTLFGLFFSFIFLSEKIETLQVIAALLVIFGLYFVNKDELRYLG